MFISNGKSVYNLDYTVKLLFNDEDFTIKLYFDDGTDRMLHFEEKEYVIVKGNIKSILLNNADKQCM